MNSRPYGAPRLEARE